MMKSKKLKTEIYSHAHSLILTLTISNEGWRAVLRWVDHCTEAISLQVAKWELIPTDGVRVRRCCLVHSLPTLPTFRSFR